MKYVLYMSSGSYDEYHQWAVSIGEKEEIDRQKQILSEKIERIKKLSEDLYWEEVIDFDRNYELDENPPYYILIRYGHIRDINEPHAEPLKRYRV